MIEIKMTVRDVLLNFFLILTPIYFMQFIITNYSAAKSRIYLGIICGIASILCMTYPIASGSGFIWDLRWIAFMISMLYGGVLSGAITAILLVVFRIFLGGFNGAVNVLVVAAILFAFFAWMRGKFAGEDFKTKLGLGIAFSMATWLVVITAISVHFAFAGNAAYIKEHALPVFAVMGSFYIASGAIYIYFSENIIHYTKMKESANKAEKVNLVSELSELLSLELKKSLSGAEALLEKMLAAPSAVQKAEVKSAMGEIRKAREAVNGYAHYSNESAEAAQAALLRDVAEEVAGLVKPYAMQKQISIECSFEHSLSLHTDNISLKQVLLNLVKNAADATPKGGKVVMEGFEKGRYVYLIIRDTGIGMSKEQLSSLFDFGSSSAAPIVGRGLRVTFHLIQEMGGTLSFQSAVGVGTTVTVKIPKN